MAIVKRGDNYYVVIYKRDSLGNKSQQWRSAGKSIKDAEKMEREKKTDYDRGDDVLSKKTKFSDFIDRWLRVEIKPKKAYKTYTNYSERATNLKKNLGKLSLERLTPEAIEDHFILESERGLSPTSIRDQYNVLRNCLKKAMKRRLIARNPCDVVDAPQSNKPKNNTFTVIQMKKFLKSIKDTPVYLPALLGFLCGLRNGEICGLRWQDINLEERALYVSHSIGWVEKKTAIELHKKGDVVWYGMERKKDGVLALGKTKTKRSQGFVPIPDELLIALKEEKKKSGIGFVWAQKNGLPNWPRRLYGLFTNALEDNGFPHIRPHDMRHTYATLLYEGGLDDKGVSEAVRHASTSFTSDRYVHPGQKILRRPAEVMNEILRD